MSLRVLKVHARAIDADAVREVLQALASIDSWEDAVGDRYEANLLLDAADAEDAIAAFEHRLSSTGVRLILSSVEATSPAPPPREDGRISRDELLDDVDSQARLDVPFLVMASLSALVAAVGLLQDSTALVIAAMVLAPLLGPNVALALATTLGNLELARRALRTGLAGLLAAAAVAVGLGLVVPVDVTAPELAARTEVGFFDLAVALASGIAAALTLTSAVPGSLVGVAVAVALVPPLVASGLLLGAGRLDLAARAILLLAINVTSINLSAMGTMLARGIRPGKWADAERARKSILRAALIWGSLLAVLAVLLWFAGPTSL